MPEVILQVWGSSPHELGSIYNIANWPQDRRIHCRYHNLETVETL